MAKIISLKKQRFTPKHKYALNEQVNSLPRSNSINELIAHLEDAGISRNEFYADRNIEYGSEKSIPSDRLLIYAKVFDCSLDDLLNQEVKAKSFRQHVQKVKTKSPLS